MSDDPHQTGNHSITAGLIHAGYSNQPKSVTSAVMLPEFSTEPWYLNPADSRCPHDAWLESVDIQQSADGAPAGITLKLLGAYHDGWIVFRYTGVRSHSLPAYVCDQGTGDWLRDEFSRSEAGFLQHRITWCSGAGRRTQWIIEAESVSYEWIPKTDGE